MCRSPIRGILSGMEFRDITTDTARAWGVLLRSDLLREGYDDRAIRRRLRRGEWRRLRAGAYLPTPAWEAMSERDRHRCRARAVLVAARTPVVLSHASALQEYDTPAWRVPLDDVHVSRPDGRAGRRDAGVVQHRGDMTETDVQVHHGVPVMNPTRVALELAQLVDLETSLAATDGLLHAGLTTVEELRRCYERMTRWPHSLPTHLLLRLADGRSESVGESRLRYLMYRYSLPPAEPQLPVRTSQGTRFLDLALPGYACWLEFDGRSKYLPDAAAPGAPGEVVWREKQREDAIRRATGWSCLRVVWADLADPARLAGRIRELIADQHGGHGPRAS